MTDHEHALQAARDSLRNVVSIRDFLLAVEIGSQTAITAVAWALAARAQERMRRIGTLTNAKRAIRSGCGKSRHFLSS
jgi:hypothetical protein